MERKWFDLFSGRTRRLQVIYGAVAQLGEHLVCTEKVAGSIPVSSTKNLLLFDNLEIGKIESPSPVIQCSQVIFKNNTLVKLLRVYGGCLGTWRR